MVAGEIANLNGMTHYWNCMPGERCDFVLFIFLDLNKVIGHPDIQGREVPSSADSFEHLQVILDPGRLCGFLWPGTLLFPLTLFLCFWSSNHSVSRIPCACRERCTVRVSHIFAVYFHIVLQSHEDMTNLDIELGCNLHHLFQSSCELCLFLFSFALSAL